MTTDTHPQTVGTGAASTADLVSAAAAQISTLVRDELALAKAEMVEKGKRAGFAGGMFGGAGALAVYGLGLVLALACVLLDIVWPTWLAVLVVTVFVFAVAAVLALVGKAQMKRAVPPVPTEAVTNVSADIDTVKTAIHDERA